MSRVKQASKKKRVTKAAIPALGAAGLTFSLAGGASASAVPAADVQPTANLVPNQALMLGDEEIADVSLATFHLFDKENTGDVRGGVQFAEAAAVAEVAVAVDAQVADLAASRGATAAFAKSLCRSTDALDKRISRWPGPTMSTRPFHVWLGRRHADRPRRKQTRR